MKRDSANNVIWWCSLVPLTLVTFAIASPYFLTHGSPSLALALERAFGVVCHQRPERSIEMFGGHVAVCGRCLGLYVGAAIGAVVVLPRRIALSLLILAAALNVSDVVVEVANLHGNSLGLRLVLGILLGFAAAAFVKASTTARTYGTGYGGVCATEK